MQTSSYIYQDKWEPNSITMAKGWGPGAKAKTKDDGSTLWTKYQDLRPKLKKQGLRVKTQNQH